MSTINCQIFLSVQFTRFIDVDEAYERDVITPKMMQFFSQEGFRDASSEVIRDMANGELGISGAIRKISEPISFPQDMLIDFASAYDSPSPIKFRPIRCQIHHGLLPSGGHYTSCCLENGVWKHYNDEKVTVMTPAEVLAALSNAYNVLFERVEEPSPDHAS